MAWAKCTTHGPIQDAQTGTPAGSLWCKCGLMCQAYEPEGWREPADLVGVQVGDNLNEPVAPKPATKRKTKAVKQETTDGDN